ncbi:MAG: FAD-dependent oxidoreductase, partial [Vitreimonas sp.]
MPRAVIVGAGPAGIAAAEILSRADVDVALVDEGRRPGGQIHRAPANGLALDMRRVLGGGFSEYEAFHAQAAAVVARVDYRPETLVWSVHGGVAHIASATSVGSLVYDVLLLATGATDRVAPAPGWTLPGVFALGGAQALLKDQGCLIGRRIAFVGSSPLLYLAALQALRVGGDVAAVVDTSRFIEKVRALPAMA